MHNLRRLAALLLIASAPSAMALEEPQYSVLHNADDYEVRVYDPYIVAEVDVDGDMRAAGNSAFRVLAGYIFGNNEPGEKMAMTAPVESTPDEEKGTYTYSFVMERKYSLASLPKPVDPRIRLLTKPSRVMAVRRYSGRWNASTDNEQRATLFDALAADDIEILSEVVMARYDSPWTPGFMRRNEVMVEIAWPAAATSSLGAGR